MLASLLDVPDDPVKLRSWFFDHDENHLQIRDAIQRQTGVNLERLILDPVNASQLDKWLADHQQMHTDFNSLFGLQSNDLSSINWEDPIQKRAWGELHYQEHLAISTTLRI